MQQRFRRPKINGKRYEIAIKEKTGPRSTMVFIKHCIKDIQNKIKRLTSNYSPIVSLKMPVFKNQLISKSQSEGIS